MEKGSIEAFAKVASMHKVVGKFDKSSTRYGGKTRPNAEGGKLKWENAKAATLTTKEGVGKYVKSEPKLMEVTKGFLEKVVGYDTYKMATDVNKENLLAPSSNSSQNTSTTTDTIKGPQFVDEAGSIGNTKIIRQNGQNVDTLYYTD